MPQPHIQHLLKIQLGAMMCDESRLPLAQTKFRLYLAESGPSAGSPSIKPLDEAQLQSKRDRFLAELSTDAEGGFVFGLFPESYQGQALELDVCIEQGGSRGCGPAEHGGQVTLLRGQPEWALCGELRQAIWSVTLPRFAWCRALGICRAQTLCGRVVDCHTHQALPGVRVAAFGLDWNQDQALGQAVTDANGRFAIHTKHPGFRRVKAGAGSLVDSYDLYFRIQSQVSAFPLYVDSIRWGERPQGEEAMHCLSVGIFVETDLARLREEGRAASFLALTGSRSVLGLRGAARPS